MTPQEPLPSISFVKASACGNDFLVVHAAPPADFSGLTRRLCDRHAGIGADGVEWLFPADDADIEARLFNADGSEAEISGNGTRCVAAYLHSRNPRQEYRIRTGAGIKTCTFVGRQDSVFEFEIAMGTPRVDAVRSVSTAHGNFHGVPVSMGNPHFVIFVERFAHDWQRQASEIALDPSFPEGVNVEFSSVRDQHTIDTRFFERGVGETQSSGTGSCASALAAIHTGRAASPVTVIAAGGTQVVGWNHEVYLRGPAQLVCRGEFFI